MSVKLPHYSLMTWCVVCTCYSVLRHSLSVTVELSNTLLFHNVYLIWMTQKTTTFFFYIIVQQNYLCGHKTINQANKQKKKKYHNSHGGPVLFFTLSSLTSVTLRHDFLVKVLTHEKLICLTKRNCELLSKSIISSIVNLVGSQYNCQ